MIKHQRRIDFKYKVQWISLYRILLFNSCEHVLFSLAVAEAEGVEIVVSDILPPLSVRSFWRPPPCVSLRTCTHGEKR